MTDHSWETRESQVSYSCDGFDIVTDRVRLPTGHETDFDYCSQPASVVVLPLTTAGDVVVIDEWRQAVGRICRGLPAGTLEPDDADPASGARRELAEETGYEADSIEHLTTVEPANGFADAIYQYFVARGCEPAGEQRLDEDETITVDTARRAELLDAIRTGDIRDGRTAFAITYFELLGGDPSG